MSSYNGHELNRISMRLAELRVTVDKIHSIHDVGGFCGVRSKLEIDIEEYLLEDMMDIE